MASKNTCLEAALVTTVSYYKTVVTTLTALTLPLDETLI